MTDPIADMLNRIRNAQAVLHPTVTFPFSNLKYKIAKILEKQEFITKVEKKGRKTKKIVEITLKYQTSRPEIKQEEVFGEDEKGKMKPVISGLRKISKPGQRIYVKSKNIRPVRGGYGIAIISTSKGIMTDKEARKQKLGGEIICEIW